MKLTLLLLLVFASVALLRAEETVEDAEEQDQPSMNDLLDGSLDDEVLGDEEDPGYHKKRRMLRRLGDKIVCGRHFHRCLTKTRYRCKLVPVCVASYYGCRCIIKIARRCIGFLRWLKKAIRRHRRRHGKRHDELDEDEDARRRRRRLPLKCRLGYRRCARRRKYCRVCLRRMGSCLKRHFIKKFCAKHGHHDEEEDETVMAASAIANDESEVADDEEDENDPRKRRLSWAQKRCLKRGLRCVLRARLNCRKQYRCVRRARRCLRRARRIRRARAKKQAKKQAKKHDE